ncbi:hypothetical protein F2Q69_00056297 [Brassica cretica]|uniref:Uncharacterized protein n=1 Tax=Brassica cretica TaxID=69181 RepID=A0A8S9N4E2_BRACR|nr:hypothetical protein F2Q69_00056297 [Brassica cretica]
MSSSAFVPLGHSAVYEAFINPNSSFSRSRRPNGSSRLCRRSLPKRRRDHVITEISRNHRLHETRWWILAILKIRYWSEIVAGPRCKTFIRRFNRPQTQVRYFELQVEFFKVGSTSQVICHELHVYPASALKASSYVQLIRPAAVVNIATLKGLKGELGKKPTALGRIVIYIKESLIDLLPW